MNHAQFSSFTFSGARTFAALSAVICLLVTLGCSSMDKGPRPEPPSVTAAPPGPMQGPLRFRATIDGVTLLKVQGSEMWYEHLDWLAPAGNARVRGRDWTPAWADERISEPFALPGTLFQDGQIVSLKKLEGRGQVTILDQPSDANEFTLTIRFDDGPQAAHDTYEIELTAIEPGPDPQVADGDLSVPEFDGELVFEGKYRHKNRGRAYSALATLQLREATDGSTAAIATLPFMDSTYMAVFKPGAIVHYVSIRQATTDRPGFFSGLEIGEGGGLLLTRRGIRENKDRAKLSVPLDAFFDPNSRPDPYVMSNLIWKVRSDLLEETWDSGDREAYDWDNSGEAMATYKIRTKHVGRETITVPAGTFEANHIVQTQVTSANTWFKKRAGHVTDFWVLDNGVVIRIIRHREPYEVELAEYSVPEKLPGHVNAVDEEPVSYGAVEVLHARFGVDDKWTDVTSAVLECVADNRYVVANSALAGGAELPTDSALWVEYRLDGIDYRATVGPGRRFEVLGEDTRIMLPPAAPAEGVYLAEGFRDGDFTTNPKWDVLIEGQTKGDIFVVDGALRMVRLGNPPRGYNASDGQVGIITEMGWPVTDTMEFIFDAKPVFRDITGGSGASGYNHPACIDITTEDANFSEIYIRLAVNYNAHIKPETGGHYGFRQAGELVGKGEWIRNLRYRIRDLAPESVRVTHVSIKGCGWDFDGYIDNLRIVDTAGAIATEVVMPTATEESRVEEVDVEKLKDMSYL